MESWEREYLVSQIISGSTLCEVEGKVYVHKNPPSEHRYYANKVYRDTYEDAKKEGIWDDNQLMQYLLLTEQWSSAEEEKLERLVKDVNPLKIKLYELRFNGAEQKLVRGALNDTRDAIDRLFLKKHSLDYTTCHGLASSAKLRYLTGASIYYNNVPYWENFEGWYQPDNLLDAIINEVVKYKITDKQIRELSRNDPWKTYWASAKNAGRGVFDLASIDLTEYQRSILLYSQMYDNIAESPDFPGDDVVDDDDLLDGWLLLQRKQREEEDNKTGILSSIKNEKIRNSEEVFIKVGNVEDAKRVHEANDFAGKVAFAQRMGQIKEEGMVKETDLKETRFRVLSQNYKNG